MMGQMVLGKYKITRQLDEGGMSKVYLARQIAPVREVVVKVLKDHLLAQPKAREHFRREIHIMARFNHPNAVAYFDGDPNDAAGPILVMEYLRGIDLNVLIQRGGRVTPERTGRLLAQLCDVLAAAHEAGIVHRDLKPGNLMVLYPNTPQETIKLMDFGLAKMSSMLYISPDELVDFTLPAAAGTPEYISPEQVRGSEIDGRGDLYSVGVILYEMLSGKRPFEGSVEALLVAHSDDRPPTFAERGLPDLVPPALEEVVRSCLQKNPDRRPRTAGELIQRYEQALGKRFTVVRRPSTLGSGLHRTVPRTAPSASTTPAPKTVGGSRQVTSLRAAGLLAGVNGTAGAAAAAEERNGLQHSIEATMPEAMAMVKLKGFIYDLGGEVVESVPGMIRVRVPDGKAPRMAAGLFGWFDNAKTATQGASTDIELHMLRKDPTQPSRLTITLVMRPSSGPMTPDWKTRCKKIGQDLGAYLMR
jgi:eukaryotic-like serine/threonine-protein kinase